LENALIIDVGDDASNDHGIYTDNSDNLYFNNITIINPFANGMLLRRDTSESVFNDITIESAGLRGIYCYTDGSAETCDNSNFTNIFIDADGTTQDGMSLRTATNVIVENVTIYNVGNGVGDHGIYVDGATSNKFKNITIINVTGGGGIDLYDTATYSTYDNIYIENTGSIGIYCQYGNDNEICDYSNFTNIIVKGTLDDAMMFVNINNVRVENVSISNIGNGAGDHGVRVEGATNNEFIGISIRNITATGLYLYDTATNSLYDRIYIDGAATIGIHCVYNDDDAICDGSTFSNIFINNTLVFSSFIIESATDITIENVTIMNSARYGLKLLNGDNVTIYGSDFRDNNWANLHVQDITNLWVYLSMIGDNPVNTDWSDQSDWNTTRSYDSLPLGNYYDAFSGCTHAVIYYFLGKDYYICTSDDYEVYDSPQRTDYGPQILADDRIGINFSSPTL